MSDSFHRQLSKRESKEIALLEVLFFFVLPIVLLYFNIIPVTGRIPVLLTFSVLIYGVMRREKWTREDLGLHKKMSNKSIRLYSIATLVAFIGIFLLARKLGMQGTLEWWKHPHFLFLFAIVSFAQEFAFRGFLLPVLKRIFSSIPLVIIVNAALFAFMHVIYPFPVIGLPFAFLAGIFFAVLYYKRQDLILVSISHAILNFVTVYFGFFTI